MANTLTTKDYLTYYDGKNELPENAFRIGASSFSTFVSRPWQWYKQQILGLDLFSQSTATTIGTICHAVAAMKAQGSEPDINEINQYIEDQSGNIDVDKSIVADNWKPMAMELVNSYVLPNINQYTSVEEFVTHDLGDGIYVGGSIDAIQGEQWTTYNHNNNPVKPNGSTSGMIVDYKTYNSTTKPTSIPPYYKQQLLVYAWVLKQHNRTMDRIRLVYINRPIDTRRISEKTGKPIGKYTPPEVTVLTELITSEDLKWIGDMISLAKEKLLATEQHPELRNLIWHFPDTYIEE